MYFADPPEAGPTIAVASPLTTVAIGLGVAVTIFLGIVPQPVLDLAQNAAHLHG
jgi:NADH-quinone oxidoreductase subunit N